jgi:Protein of unknown function (DUF3465)
MKPSNVRITRKLNAAIVRDNPRRARVKAVLIETAVAVLAVIFVSCASHDPATKRSATPHDDSPIGRAFASGTSDIQVEGEGSVIRILSDDVDGSRHQRFIVQLASGQTLLITHNIDVAPRIAGLKVGDSVSFNGEYVWNEKGGVIHWTHHDPQGRHVAGWVMHKGKRYQ